MSKNCRIKCIFGMLKEMKRSTSHWKMPDSVLFSFWNPGSREALVSFNSCKFSVLWPAEAVHSWAWAINWAQLLLVSSQHMDMFNYLLAKNTKRKKKDTHQVRFVIMNVQNGENIVRIESQCVKCLTKVTKEKIEILWKVTLRNKVFIQTW